MWRNIASNALTLILVALVVAGSTLAWAKREFTNAGPLVAGICLKVDRGSNLSLVSDDLVAQGAVTSGTIFRLGARYSDRAPGLKFGSYLIPARASMTEILAMVTGDGQSTCGTEINYRIGVAAADMVLRELDPGTNRYVEVAKFDPAVEAAPPEFVAVQDAADTRLRVTLAEGVTSWQVVEALKRAPFLAGELADPPAEGSLAPDSYEVDHGGDRAALLAEMAARQSAVLAELWASRAADLPVASAEEALVLASLVEKETGVTEERARVASVFVNRLNQGIKLQTDPAVIYGLTKGKSLLGRGLRASELRSNTPYNTYVHAGLPPGPIANPGRASIEAALHPETTDYLFFVADGTGGHAFAATLAEHNDNVAKWRALEKLALEKAALEKAALEKAAADAANGGVVQP